MPHNDSASQAQQLQEMLVGFGVPVSADQAERLDGYRRLLWSWNERMNLTRHTTLEKFATRDLFDSYQLGLLLEPGQRILDVGTGGGVPGLVLAILRPDLKMSVCESTGKKAVAVEAIVEELDLPVTVYSCRAEEVIQIATFDTLIARAVAPLPKVLRWFAPHWEAFDRLLLVKGRNWTTERGDARHQGLLKELQLRKSASYQTPGTEMESVILSLWKEDAPWSDTSPDGPATQV